MSAFGNLRERFITGPIGGALRDASSIGSPQEQQDSSKKQPSALKALIAAIAAGVATTYGVAQLGNPDGLGCDIDINVGAELAEAKVQELSANGAGLTIGNLDKINHETRIQAIRHGDAHNCPQSAKRMLEQRRLDVMNKHYNSLGQSPGPSLGD